MTHATVAQPLPPPSALHERIVWARKRKGISQEALAARIGTSRRHMIRIEKGTVRRPGPVFLERIAEATDQPLEFFADEDDEESDPVNDLTRAIRAFVRQEVGRREVAMPSPRRS